MPKYLKHRAYVCAVPGETDFVDEFDARTRGRSHCMWEFDVRDLYEIIPDAWMFDTFIAIANDSPDYDRISHEDVAYALLKTPEPNLVQELIVLDLPHPDAAWLEQTTGRTVDADTGEYSDILLFRPNKEQLEWSILFQWFDILLSWIESDAEFDLFFQAAVEESFHNPIDDSRIEHPRMIWCTYGSILMIADFESGLIPTVAAHPILAAILARVVLKRIEKLDEYQRDNEWTPGFHKRARFIVEVASPLALMQIETWNLAPDAVRRFERFLNEYLDNLNESTAP